jgi:hypothetical protein
MAVSRNGSGFFVGDNLGDPGSVTLSNVIVPSGTNQILIVWVAENVNSSSEISGVTWNGVTLTNQLSFQSAANQGFTTLWFLLNPTPATANVVATFSSAEGIQVIGAYTLQGVNQSTPFGNIETKEASGASVSQTIVGTSGDLLIDCLYDTNQSTVEATTTGTGQTLIGGDFNSGASQTLFSQEPSAPSATMGWTSSDPNPFFGNYVVVDVQQAAAGSTAPIAWIT